MFSKPWEGEGGELREGRREGSGGREGGRNKGREIPDSVILALCIVRTRTCRHKGNESKEGS